MALHVGQTSSRVNTNNNNNNDKEEEEKDLIVEKKKNVGSFLFTFVLNGRFWFVMYVCVLGFSCVFVLVFASSR